MTEQEFRKQIVKLREQIAKEIEAKYMMSTFTKYEEGFDDGLKYAVDTIRGKYV